MIIKKIILKGYKRFFLSGIDYLEYSPQNTIQMIASRNLSGKSSLLRQLNPLPADIKKDFKENGYKEIHIEHLNNQYEIRSDGKHSFKCNNIELNPGGTKKVQLELVKDHFKITPQMMDILYNLNSLTMMSPSERKYWFTEMSHVDYVYPVTVYNLLKQRHRDILGFIKFTQDDIVKCELNINNKENIEKLCRDRDHLEKYINHIISLYDHNVRPSNETDILNQIEEYSKELEALLQSSNSDLNKEEIINNITQATGLLSSYNNSIENYKKEIDKLDKIQNIGNYNDLIKKLELLKNKKEILEKNVYIALTNNRYNDIWIAYGNLYGDVMSYFDHLLEYEDVRHLSKEEIEQKIIENKELNLRYKAKVNKLNLVKSELEHMLKHKTQENIVTCEKCQHSWYLNYNPNKETDYNKEIKQLELEIKELEDKLNQSTLVIDKLKSLEEMNSNFKQLLKSEPLLLPLWQYIFNKYPFKSCNISEVLSELNKLSTDLNQWKELDDINKEINILENNIDNIKAVEQAHKDNSKNILEHMIKNLEETTKLKNETLQILEKNKLELQIKNKMQELYNKLSDTLIYFRKTLKSKEIALRNQYLLDLVDLLKTELIQLETLIGDNKKAISVLENSKKALDEAKIKEKILNIACKILSPDEGLIAKSINGFINVIVSEMNDIINSIWTYDLEVLPCEVNEDTDLDYKFKVKVNNDQIIEDVSKLSSSGKEIVDLAFRIVFSKYMDLIDFPLFLDEFGNTFDKAHRIAAYNVIDKIMTSDYKQMFIICHFESIYGSLKNVDFNVLDSNNIDLDPSIEINKVMKIIRQ